MSIKEQLNTVTNILAVSSIAAIGLAFSATPPITTISIIGTIIGSMGINLVSSDIQQLKEKFLSGIRNHDLQNVSTNASMKAFRDLENSYLKQIGTGERHLREELQSVKSFFDDLDDHVKNVLSLEDTTKSINERDFKNYIRLTPEKIIEKIRTFTQNLTLYQNRFIEFFIEHFDDYFSKKMQFYFFEELKTDTRAWRVFQRLMFESLDANVKVLQTNQDLLLIKLDDIRKQLENLKDNDLRTAEEPFQNGLEDAINMLKQVVEKLDQVLKEILETKKEVIETKKEILDMKRHLEYEIEIIPTIQSVLNKEGGNKGDFFKKEPEWIDFEQGFVIERKEVGEIINRLETEKIQLVMGISASGKSTILKNVGFKLAKNIKVYMIESKKYSQEDIKHFFDNIPRINDENTVFIVDDIHLYISECEKLIKNFKSHGSGKLIIGSRDTEKIKGSPKDASQFEYLNKIYIKAENVTEEIIKRFLTTKYGFDDERISIISQNLEQYKDDLWFLSWALKVYDPNKDFVDDLDIYENIKDSIRNIKVGDNTINAENILLPLSIFYNFEIQIQRKFLEKQMNINAEMIDQLIKLAEIKQIEPTGEKRMLYLHHSSIAELYFGAYQNYPDFGEEIKERILGQQDEKFLEYCLFRRYMMMYPRGVFDIIINLFNYKELSEIENLAEYNEIGHTRESWLLDKLVKDSDVILSIERGIEEEDDITNIGLLLAIIKSGNFGSKLVNNIDISILASKIDKEEDLNKIKNFFLYILISPSYILISPSYKDFGSKLVNNIDISILASKVDKEEDLIKIGDVILYCSVNKDSKLVNNIDISILVSKIDKEEDLIKIGDVIYSVNKDFGSKLVNNIDISILASKIDKEEDLNKIGHVILYCSVNKDFGSKLVNNIDISVLASKIDKEETMSIIARLIYAIESTNKDIAQGIINSLNHKNIEGLEKRISFHRNYKPVRFWHDP